MVLDFKELTKKINMKYAVLAAVQVVILILFFVFVRYGPPKEAPGFEGTHVMIFIGFGYLMTFLKKYCYSALGFNWLLASIVAQWAMLCQNFFHMDDGKILVNKFNMLEADIMAAATLITFGAILGVANGLQLIVISLVETAVACTNLYLLEEVFQVCDPGGSMAIHTFGAYFGLACSFAMKKGRKATEEEPTQLVKLDEPSYGSDVTAMIGSIFLWIYWPSFNSGLISDPAEYDRAVMNTYLSLAACVVVTFFMSSLLSHQQGKFDMVHIQNSTLAGGVAVGAICNMHVSPGGAIAVGMGAGALSVAGYRFLTPKMTRWGILDTCGVHNLHGMPGVYSGILSAIIASFASAEVYGENLVSVFPAMGEEDKRSSGMQGAYQAIGLAVTIALAIVSGAITGFICKFLRPLKAEECYDDAVDWEVPAER